MRSQLSIAGVFLMLIVYGCSSADAKPSTGNGSAFRTIDGHYIIGGVDAIKGAWPWQLSFQYNGGSGFSHFCGASLIKANGAISAAHCVEDMLISRLRVVAGLHDRRDLSGTEIRSLTKYTMHPLYDTDELTYDIATLEFSAIADNGFTIGYGKLPLNNNDDFSTTVCVLTGWGRTDHSPTSALPNILQQVSIGVLSVPECNMILAELDGISVEAFHICAYDSQQNRGSCNGDSGGPMHCPTSTGYVVAGVCSWGLGTQTYRCNNRFPSVYTKTSYFLDWISSNLP